MTKFVTRAYNRFEVDNLRGTTTKYSSNDKLNNEIRYYQTVQQEHSDLSIFFPRIIKSDIGYMGRESSIEMELYAYDNLGIQIVNPSYVFNWNSRFISLSNIFSLWQRVIPSVDLDTEKLIQQMYITKTEEEYKKFVNGWPDPMFGKSEVSINEKLYKNFHVIWPDIKSFILETMCKFEPSFIHGDCCMSNILYEDDTFRFIDPRGSFGDHIGVFGDPRYDIAKLYHSTQGYELFINDVSLFKEDPNLNGETNYYIFQHNYISTRQKEAIEEFENIFFPQYDKKEIQIITGTIFIGMCARHFDSNVRQRQMYLTGVKLLNEALEL